MKCIYGQHDWREVFGGKTKSCVKCNIRTDIKEEDLSSDIVPSWRYEEYRENRIKEER